MLWSILPEFRVFPVLLQVNADIFGFEYHTENVKGLKLCLCTEISRSDVGSSVSYYIDDMKLYSEKSLSMIQNEQYENKANYTDYFIFNWHWLIHFNMKFLH